MDSTIVAHRGASKYAPENTMCSFELAEKLNAQMIELDVHLTKDHIPIVIHDETLNRTTNGKGFVRDYTFNELCLLDAGSWFSPQYANCKIPSLEEVLAWLKETDLNINIELKNNKIDYENLEELVISLLEKYSLFDRTIVTTFNYDSLLRLKKYKDKVQFGFLTSKRRSYSELVQLIKDTEIDALHFKYSILTPLLMSTLENYNIASRVYTVNKKTHMLQCFKYRCTSIITDVPDIGLEQFMLFNNNKPTFCSWRFWKK